MTAQEKCPDARQNAQIDNHSESAELQKRKPMGLALLGAAVLIPAVCFYLSKYLIKQGRDSLKSQRASARDTARFREGHRPSERIQIPIGEAQPSIDDKPEDVTGDTPQQAPSPATAPFVGSNERDKFHVPTCRWARQIQEVHRISFITREDAIAKGYTPCGSCKP